MAEDASGAAPKSGNRGAGPLGRWPIGRRLAAGFVVLMLLMAGLGIVAQIQMARLADQTVNLYRHPFAVSNAVLQVRADILAIHRTMKDLAVSNDLVRLEAAAGIVAGYEQAIFNHFEIINDRFLGDRAMVQAAEQAIADWRPIRDQVITLTTEGAHQEAAAITRGIGAEQVARIDDAVGALHAFARGKAAEFMGTSEAIRTRAVTTMWGWLAGSIALGFVVAIVISRSITVPMAGMTGAVSRLAQGDDRATVPGTARSDEIGRMARALAILRDRLLARDEPTTTPADAEPVPTTGAAGGSPETRDRLTGAPH